MDTKITGFKFPETNSYLQVAGTTKRSRFSLPPPPAQTDRVSNRKRSLTFPALSSYQTFPAPPPNVAKGLLVTLQQLDLTKLVVPHVGHPKSPRDITAGDTNIGPTRQLSLELEKPLDATVSLKDTANVHARQICDAIRDDAERRIQFLYYQLLAYWKEGCKVSLGQTIIQHGVATSPRCGGAHSALLPHLIDDHLDVLGRHIECAGIDDNVRTRMLSLGFSDENIQKIKKSNKPLIAFREAVTNYTDKTSLLGGKVHLYHTGACTIEMPSYVNEFHTLFERDLRLQALEHLNYVSLENGDPYESLDELCEFLEKFLITAKEQTKTKIELVQNLLKLEADWQELQLQVTANQVKDKEDFLRKYLLIGVEIVDTVTSIKKNSGHSLNVPTTHLGEYFKFVNMHRSIIEGCTTVVKRKKKPKNVKSAADRFDDAYLELSTSLAIQRSIRDSNLGESLARLENSTVVIDLLRKHSGCPSKNFLSGKCEKGTWELFTPDQIMEQKYQIISQRTLDITINKNPSLP